jgi:hypothetical protein
VREILSEEKSVKRNKMDEKTILKNKTEER